MMADDAADETEANRLAAEQAKADAEAENAAAEAAAELGGGGRLGVGTPASVDDVLGDIGEFGRYQQLHYVGAAGVGCHQASSRPAHAVPNAHSTPLIFADRSTWRTYGFQ